MILYVIACYHLLQVHPGYGFLSENKDFAKMLVGNSVNILYIQAVVFVIVIKRLFSKNVPSYSRFKTKCRNMEVLRFYYFIEKLICQTANFIEKRKFADLMPSFSISDYSSETFFYILLNPPIKPFSSRVLKPFSRLKVLTDNSGN